VEGRKQVIGPVEISGEAGNHALAERREHDQNDHDEVEQHHARLANPVGAIVFSPGERHPSQ